MNTTLIALFTYIKNKITGRKELNSILSQFTKTHKNLSDFISQANAEWTANEAQRVALAKANARLDNEAKSAASIRTKIAEFIPAAQ